MSIPKRIACQFGVAVALACAQSTMAGPVAQNLVFNGAGNNFSGNLSGSGTLSVSGTASLTISTSILGTPVNIATGAIGLNPQNSGVTVNPVNFAGASVTGTGQVTAQDSYDKQLGPSGPNNPPNTFYDDGPTANNRMDGQLTDLDVNLISSTGINAGNPTLTGTLSFSILGIPINLPQVYTLQPTNMAIQNLTYNQSSSTAGTSNALTTFGNNNNPSSPASLDLSARNTGVTSGGNVNGAITGNLGAVVQTDFGIFGTRTDNLGSVAVINTALNPTGVTLNNNTVDLRELPTANPVTDDLRVDVTTPTSGALSNIPLTIGTTPFNFNQSFPIPVDLGVLGQFTLTGTLAGTVFYSLNATASLANFNMNLTSQTVVGVVDKVGNGTYSANNISYGNILVGQTATNAVTVTNTASQIFTNLTGTIGASSTPEITPTSGTTGFDLATGGSSSRNFTYAPVNRGTDSTNVTITTNVGVDQTQTLTGTGVAPVSTSIGNITIGPTLVGTSSGGFTSVQNVGDGNLSGLGAVSNLNGSISAGSGVFARVGGSSVSLLDSQSQNITFQFTPTVRGAASQGESVSFINGNPANGGDNTAHVRNFTVNATGVAPVNQVSSTTLNFGNVRVGTSGSQAVTITNVGDGNLSGLGAISNLQGSLSGPTPVVGVGFTGAGGLVNLGDAAASNFTYGFSPSTYSASQANVAANFLNGNTNNTNSAQNYNIVLTGNGVGPTFAASWTDANGFHTTGPGFATPGPGIAGTIDLGVVSASAGNIFLPFNLSNIFGTNLGNLTDLSLLSFSISGLYQTVGFSTGVLSAGGSTAGWQIEFLNPGVVGTFTGQLIVSTDEFAPFGSTGNSFIFNLEANLVPEPASIVLWGMAAMALGGLVELRRRRQS